MNNKKIRWFTPNTYDTNFKTPPNRCGIYCIIVTDLDPFSDNYMQKKLVYVGSSSNLLNRYNKHEVFNVLIKTMPYHHIKFLFREDVDYINVEKCLIKRLKPILNKTHNTTNKLPFYVK